MIRNVKRKKIVISILFLIIIIIQILAFRLSTANNVINLNINFIDNSSNLETFIQNTTAVDKSSKGYLINLPEEINGIKVNKYYIEEELINQENTKEIDNITYKNTINEIEEQITNEIIDNNIVKEDIISTDEIEKSIIEVYPLEDIYINKKEIDNNSISIKVEYDYLLKEEQTLYNQEIISEINGVKIKATGYMPINSQLIISEVSTADIADTIKESQEEKVNINFAYDIKIKVDDLEYEPEDFGNYVQININGVKIKTQNNNKVLHIKEDNTVDEVKVIEKKKDEVTFKADSFSIYALVTNADELGTATSEGLSWSGDTASKFKFGEGTKKFPYLITSGEELSYLAQRVNSGETFEGIYFQVTQDLNLNNISWTPIGSVSNSFKGIFDGAGHTISNISIAITNSNNDVEAYGVFGSIGGGSEYTEIKNVVFDGVNIDLAVTRTISSNSYGYKIGTVCGTMYNHSKIANIIVKNSLISDSGTITFYYPPYIGLGTVYQPIMFVGGIAGDAVNNASNTDDPGDGARCIIENCYSNVNFSLDVTASRTYYGSNLAAFGQYYVGGIIGRIKSQPVWPEGCLYEGEINATNAFTGPIFGATINTTSYSSTSNFNTIWNGNDVGSLAITSYYGNYSTNNTTFTSTVISGNVDESTTYRRSTSSSNIGYVQGVNKGRYLEEISSMLSNFNNHSSEEYLTWSYSNSTFVLNKEITAKVDEIEEGVYVASLTSNLENPQDTYAWYVDDSDEVASETDTITIEHEIEKDHTAIVLISDGKNYTTVTITVEKYTLYFEFTYNANLNRLTANYAGTYTETPFWDASKFTIKWYKTDLTDLEPIKEEISGTTLIQNNIDKNLDYVIVATNIEDENIQITGTYTIKTVIYLDYENGNNTNDGLTTDTPVKTMQNAYSKLDETNEKENNIIVVMSNYTGSEYLNDKNSTYYDVPASIVGAYNGLNYNSSIYFEAYDSYRYLVEDTRFKNISFDGEGSQTYLYAQGFDLTMDEGVRMINYAESNTNQGLITGVSPAFHIFGAWNRYNYATLPRNNSTLLIKSGTYGRIIAGGSPGTTSSQSIVQATTSHNFTGSSMTDIFTNTVIINIENSTTDFNTYTYDVNLIVGGSAWGNTYANVTENIYSGVIGRVLGGSIGDSGTKPTTTWNYPSNTFIGYATTNIYGGSVKEVYGGCLGRNMTALRDSSNTNLCDAYFYGQININISGGKVTDAIYGAGAGGVTGYSANSTDPYKSYGQDVQTSVTINISGGEVTADVYGGGYGYTEYLTESTTTTDAGTLYGTSNITIGESANISGNIYGAGRGYELSSKPKIAGMDGNTTISINGSPIITGNIYGAGAGIEGLEEVAKLTGNSSININASITKEVYGGGNVAKVNGDTRIYLNWGESDENTIYGGGNLGEIEGNTYIYLNNGNNGTIYGGGNLAQVYGNTNVIVNGGNAQYVYGGGNQAGLTGITNVELSSGSINEAFGGGNKAGAQNTNVKVTGTAIVNKVFGASNQTGTVEVANVNIEGGTVETVYGSGKVAEAVITNLYLNSGTVVDAYAGGEEADVTDNANVELNGAEVTNIYGGSNMSGTVQKSNVIITKGNVVFVYGGNNAGGTTVNSNITTNGGTIKSVYGGNNQAGTTEISNIVTNSGIIETVYGGNNQGGTTTTSNVHILGGTIENVYGGGDRAETINTNVEIKAVVNKCVYGGGNLAGVNENTNLKIENASIEENIYGGGNEGIVEGNTYVNIKNSTIKGSSYAGGNGTTATVKGNTNIDIEGTSIIGEEKDKITTESGCVFGGGNAAQTGTEDENLSSATVNIAGGKIYGNVYGGANTSKIYGSTIVNIGKEATGKELEIADVNISGTVFGGGEANASGSENYDFSYISVTTRIDINIDGTGYNELKVLGSIFGSGNASSTSGTSYININNYGTSNSPEKNISLQRANLVTLNNSSMTLSGTTDRTNDFSDVIYTVSRVDELKLKNNSSIYLNCGANLLKKLSSYVDIEGVEQKGYARIDDTTNSITKNVDNRIYILQGQNLNIATNQQATSYGEVEGMFFFGLYTNKNSPSGSTGLYNTSFENGDLITNAGTFSYNSYVMAAHKVDHDITVDGFYSNYNNNGFIQTRYIKTTPEDDVYYIWLAGEELDVTTFNVSLTASKYTTMGTYELSLMGFGAANTKMIVTGFSSGLEEGITLKSKSDIPTVAENVKDADSNYALVMKSGNKGWITNNNTEFLADGESSYTGSTKYNEDNSTTTPSLLFYLYHSQNLSQDRELGEVTIRLQVFTPVDELNYKISYIDIIISMKEALHQGYAYEASITPGEEFSLFTTTPTNITTSSKFSTYYSLYEENFSASDYKDDYLNYERVLVSTRNEEIDSFVYPQNTKITMIDLSTNEIYYYVVTAQDEADSKNVYKLSDFLAMGSTDKKYDEKAMTEKYYNEQNDSISEEFIFQVDFSESGISESSNNNYLLIELRDVNQETLIGVLGINRDTNTYGLYPDTNASIKVKADVTNTDNTVYLGDTINLNVETNFEQMIVDSNTVYDTEYFNNKMGIKLTIYDDNGNQLSGDTLLGVKFILDGITYYPRTDGTVRINIAERVANVLSKIKIDTTENNVIATGTYTIKVESFGSPDGIYYGTKSSSTTETTVTIINLVYGLDVSIDSSSKIIDKEKGYTQEQSNVLSSIITYSSGLANPNINVALYRRDYSSIYSQNYEIVDLQDYAANTLASANEENEYIAFGSPTQTNVYNIFLKQNLKTGTYKLVYKLYDSDNYIGEEFEYIIIK